MSSEIIQSLDSKRDPLYELLEIVRSTSNMSFRQLHELLQLLDRYDVIDDTEELFAADAQYYMEKRDCNITNPDLLNSSVEQMILTVGDSVRLEKGLDVELYDAFLLHSEEDNDFAMDVVNKMENEFSLKLCLRFRDLVGGVGFTHEAITNLIEKRCNRLVVLFSPSFIQSSENQFFVSFAQALAIEQRHRKIIPCIYKHCELPSAVRYSFCLDYTRSTKYWNFWEKLRDSIKSPTPSTNKVSSVFSELVQSSLKSTPTALTKLDSIPKLPTKGKDNIPSKVKNEMNDSGIEYSFPDIPQHLPDSSVTDEEVSVSEGKVQNSTFPQPKFTSKNGTHSPWFKRFIPKQDQHKKEKKKAQGVALLTDQ